MVDQNGKSLAVGDYVRFWFNRNGDHECASVGTVLLFYDTFAKVKYQDKHGDKLTVFRSKSGLTKLTDSEAMLYILEDKS